MMTIDLRTLVIIAGAALPLPAIASDPATTPTTTTIPVMPEQIEGNCDVFALVDSTSLVSRYTAVQIDDLDGDGSVTDADFVEWIKTLVAPNLVIKDVDGDGYITAVDEVAALAAVLNKLSGDPDADAAADAVNVLISFRKSLTRSYYTNGHLSEITRFWGDRHCTRTSGFDNSRDRERYPPNHDFTFSAGWPDNHSRRTSRNWPPQHTASTSEGWGPPGSDPDEHRTGTSRGWPPQHERDQSAQWGVPDGQHDVSVSSRWPPNHDSQQSSVAGLPLHDEAMSELTTGPDYPPSGFPSVPGNNPGPSDHDANFSNGWENAHGRDTSQFFWPSNHSVAMSGTWGPIRGVKISSYWPSQHHGTVSRSWPVDGSGVPPWWAPNHVTEVSSQGTSLNPSGSPRQIPLLPEGHSASDPATTPTTTTIPVMPEQIEGNCDVFALVDSTAMVSRYTAVQIDDLDGDGSVTDADFVEWIKTLVAPNLVVKDVDGNDYITAVDEVAALTAVLNKLSGDPDADATADAVKVLISFPTSLTRSFYTQGHLWAITMTWVDQHCATTSGFASSNDIRRYPPNHSAAISTTWPRDHSISTSKWWPAQHGYQVSDGWGPPGDGPDEHHSAVSLGWPAHHARAQSLEWNEPPYAHGSYTSSRWPPNHDFAQSSGAYLPPHDATISEIFWDTDFPTDSVPYPMPGHAEHDSEFSQTWVHNQASSSFLWPPNHTTPMSGTWSNHDANLSKFWPTNHHAAASFTWQPNDDGGYPWWPANHASTTSKQEDGPAITTGRPWWLPNLFPPKHQIFTSFQQLVPLFSD